MRRSLLAAAAALLMATTAQAANETRLFSSGYWQTTYFAKNTEGEPMCSMSGNWQWSGGVTGKVMVKWSASTGLFMHVTKSNWSMDAGEDVPLSVSFDRGTRNGNGSTRTSPSGSSFIEIEVPNDDAVGFLEDFGEANELTIAFKHGNERPWVGKMIGSRKASSWFASCIAKVAEAASNVTQPAPAPKSEPTQPLPKKQDRVRAKDASI